MGELFKQLSNDLSTFVRQELKLAQAEMTEKGKNAGIGVGMFGAAAILGLVALSPDRLPSRGVGNRHGCLAGGAARDRCLRRHCRWLALLAKQKGHRSHAACARTNRRDHEGGHAMGEDPAAIREEIEETRERMGETVDALGYKADVPSRAKESITGKVHGAKAKVTGAGTQISDATPSGEDVRQAVGPVQENPLGLAMGAGAAGSWRGC